MGLKAITTNGGGGGGGGVFTLTTIGVTVDGGGSTPTTGIKGYFTVPYAGTITGYTLSANVSGSAIFDVWKVNAAIPTVANTITGSALPTLSSQQYLSSTTLTGWTTSVAIGDVFGYNLNSISTISRITLQLNIQAS